MKTSFVYSLALALASSTVLTESFSIRQILRVAAPRGRGGASVQRDAALVVDSSASSGALSQDLALFDEPRLYTRQGVARALPVDESSSRTFIHASSKAALPAETLRRRTTTSKSPSLGRLEIPRHIEPDLAKAKMVLSLEILLGRAAMVASVVLFVVELTTGQSLPDQLFTLL
jgi:hypothetical protein